MRERVSCAKHAVFNFSLLLAAINFSTITRAGDGFESGALPDTLVVKMALGPDGNPGAVEAVTPVNTGMDIDSLEAAKEIAGLADRAESDALEQCRNDVEAALEDLRRVARQHSRADVAFTTRHVAKACNIPCTMKQEFGVSCDNEATRVYRRHFDNYTVTGQVQYSNINLPVYGIFTNSYNPYGNIYFPFTNSPWTWYQGPHVYFFFQRRR
jgi:hypothetical protein